jgi:hypothetical protein
MQRRRWIDGRLLFLAAKFSLAGSWQAERICHSMDTFIIGRKGSAIENVSLFCIIDQSS